jgi:hypothetical protein
MMVALLLLLQGTGVTLPSQTCYHSWGGLVCFWTPAPSVNLPTGPTWTLIDIKN